MRYALLDFIADFANWDASTATIFLETARALTQAAHESLDGAPGMRPLVVDPFAGGGSIPIEALRIGADAFASDLNPVAVLLNKVELEYVPKYGQQLSHEVRRWGMWIKEQVVKDLAEFYPRDSDRAKPIAYLWARKIICEGPGCGTEIPLMRSLWLSKKSNRPVALHIVPNKHEKRVDFEIIYPHNFKDVEKGTIRRVSVTCPVCGYTTPMHSVRQQLRLQQGGAANARLYVVVTTHDNQLGRFYRLPTKQDFDAVDRAEKALEKLKKDQRNFLSIIPDELLPTASSFLAPPRFGMDKFNLLFTPRQMLALTTLSSLVYQVGENLALQGKSDLAIAVQTCLSLAFNRIVDRTSSLCTWRPQADQEKVEHVFTRQALQMTWDFAEGVPITTGTASWDDAYEPPAQMIDSLSGARLSMGTSTQASATTQPLPDNAAKCFFTDPPYYNAVPYADLSDFFYIWLKRTIGEQYPDLFHDQLVNKEEEICEMAGYDSERYPQKTGNWFEEKMGLAMLEGHRVLSPMGIGIVVFAHKSTSGWEALLQAMIDAGWTITGSWPIDTEMGNRLRAMNSAVLASSIHLVCRPRKNFDGSTLTGDIGDWRDVLYELPTRIHDWMPRLAQEGVVGADAIFSCLGPALEIFSRYSRVERADGEQVKLKEYLEYVWAAVSKEALNMIFQGADTSGFDADARLTAMWLWTLSTRETGKTNGQSNSKTVTLEVDDMVDEEEISPKQVIAGYVLEFDAARKIAQGLGANLDKLSSLVEIKGSAARLRSVTERGHFLFDRNVSELQVTKPRRKSSLEQLAMFSVQELEAEFENANDTLAFNMGSTMLDRLHQAMLLFAAGRSDALKRFLTEEGVGNDQRFWRLAQALSSLYPLNSEERRWVEGVQGYKKGLGL